jgi:2,3-bisphosphoglycerate-independent phosphoglycerate mutase
MKNNYTTVLCILDGLGLNPKTEGNAVAQAIKPNFDRLNQDCPHTTLMTHGERVGLPEGQMGNSEVGHLNIGAGRVVDQWLQLIGKTLKNSDFQEQSVFKNFLSTLNSNSTIHLMGLLSNGGVHSHEDHLFSLIDILLKCTTNQLGLHIITDGRDTSPNSAILSLEKLNKLYKNNSRVKVLTLQGRFYAMDRDNRWERVSKAYQVLTGQVTPISLAPEEYLKNSYDNQHTDEFIEPTSFAEFKITPDDNFIFWNFRADRMREIVKALTSTEFSEFARSSIIPSKNKVICFTEYDKTLQLPFIFSQPELINHLGQVVSEAGLTQLRVAETEKYPHVTYFLSGGSENVLPGEERALIPSPRDVKTYDLKPEMSAFEVKEQVVNAIKNKEFDLIVVNFANCDMVGHTGVLEAGIKAVETVDQCLGEIISAINETNGKLLVIADHGNAEQMINYEDGSPHTAHTTNPVPCILYTANKQENVCDKLRSSGALCDVAPTILDLLGLPKPKEMTGVSLIEGKLS